MFEKGVERLQERGGKLKWLNDVERRQFPCCSLPFLHNAHTTSTRPVFDHLYSRMQTVQTNLLSLRVTAHLDSCLLKHSQWGELTKRVLM